jgi:hypothetical protein
MKFYCDNVLDGGGWVLVRRVRQGSVWHPTTDNLAGTEPAYGTYGGPTFDATFGRPYSSWIQSSTEFLFTTGLTACSLLQAMPQCNAFNLTICRRPQQVAHHHMGPNQQQWCGLWRQFTSQGAQVERPRNMYVYPALYDVWIPGLHNHQQRWIASGATTMEWQLSLGFHCKHNMLCSLLVVR